MDVNIHIYLKRLKDFFDNDREAYHDMFGHEKVDMDEFYKMVAAKATINNKKNGDPVLSGNEMLEIITDLTFQDIRRQIEIENFNKEYDNPSNIPNETSRVFVHIKDGFPPMCLN